jgi:thioester reductase-like protein
VLLTGTTGGLGSNALAVLIDDPTVKRIYALNRTGKSNLKVRQADALKDRGLGDKVSALDSEKVVLLEGDASQEDLGLANDAIDEVCTTDLNLHLKLNMARFFIAQDLRYSYSSQR